MNLLGQQTATSLQLKPNKLMPPLLKKKNTASFPHPACPPAPLAPAPLAVRRLCRLRRSRPSPCPLTPSLPLPLYLSLWPCWHRGLAWRGHLHVRRRRRRCAQQPRQQPRWCRGGRQRARWCRGGRLPAQRGTRLPPPRPAPCGPRIVPSSVRSSPLSPYLFLPDLPS